METVGVKGLRDVWAEISILLWFNEKWINPHDLRDGDDLLLEVGTTCIRHRHFSSLVNRGIHQNPYRVQRYKVCVTTCVILCISQLVNNLKINELTIRLGPKVGGHLALYCIHHVNQGALSQWFKHDDTDALIRHSFATTIFHLHTKSKLSVRDIIMHYRHCYRQSWSVCIKKFNSINLVL